MMKRLLSMVLLIVLMLCGCSRLKESDRMSHIYYDGTDWVDIHWWDYNFEEQEAGMRGDIGLTRNKVFGDSELQEAAKKAARRLNLTEAADLLEYAARITPAVIESGYLSEAPNLKQDNRDWKLHFIVVMNDGVASLHYDEKADPEYENGIKLEARYGKMDGGSYVIVSLLDGHIISFQGAHYGLISGKEPGTWTKKKDFEIPPHPSVERMVFHAITMEEKFYYEYQHCRKDDATYHAVPTSRDARIPDEKLQESAKELAECLNIRTPEGMAEYLVKLGDRFLDTNYQICGPDFEVYDIDRYVDGVWSIDYTSKFTDTTGKETIERSSVYVSEDDGHLVCIIDWNGKVITGNSNTDYH